MSKKTAERVLPAKVVQKNLVFKMGDNATVVVYAKKYFNHIENWVVN